jgi:Tfp pilus assembly protein PilN
MTVRVNLLPEDYRQARRRDRRFRWGVLAGLVLLGAEVAAAGLFYLRAEETREMLARTGAARMATQELRGELDAPKREAERLAQQVAVAERLRSKHHWSRLLNLLAELTPDKVVITAVSTDPPQWSPALRGRAADARHGGQSGRGAATPVPRLIEGLTVNGVAVDHGDLSKFMAALHQSQSFADVDLRQARRERYLDREAILFELQCRW